MTSYSFSPLRSLVAAAALLATASSGAFADDGSTKLAALIAGP